MNALTLTIPHRLWLTSNRHHDNRQHRAAIVRDLHTLAATEAVAQRLTPATGPCAAAWTVHYPKGVSWEHGDAANAQPTTKACLDALVPRWLPLGDGPRAIVTETFTRGPNLDVAGVHRIVLTLETT